MSLARGDSGDDVDRVQLKPIGFWRQGEEEDASGLPHPSSLVDESWPLVMRARVAKYLRAGQTVCAYHGYSFCRMNCGILWHFMGSRDLTDGTFVWPEGFAHYVEHHAVKPPEDFLRAIEPRLPIMLPTWRVGYAFRKIILERRIAAARREAEAEAKLPPRTTPLHDAAQSGDRGKVEEALASHAIDLPNRSGETALFLAARAGHAELVKLLLARGAAVDAKDESGVTPLSQAGSCEVAVLLLEAGAAIAPEPVAHSAPLARACTRGDLELVRILVERGADPNAGDKFRTPLESSSSAAMIELLLSLGADPKKGQPLAAIARSGDADAVEKLLAAGADPNACDTRKQSPLFLAASKENGDRIVELLLAAGADPNAESDLKDTPLHMACGRTSIATVENLLAAGARVDSKSTRGMTPLHWAALSTDRGDDRAAVLAILIEHGANAFDAKDEWGRTPLTIAQSKADEAAIRVLTKAAEK